MITINIAKSNKCNGDNSLYISFPYDNTVVDIIRNLPSRFWDKDRKMWEVPAKKLSELISKLHNYEITLTGDFSSFETPETKATLPADFKFKTSPFEHQIDGFNFGLSHDRWLLGDEQGLGKTKQVIDIAVAKKSQGIKKCLIVCAVNGLKWNWQKEIETHSDETGWILGQRTRKGKVSIGSNTDKLNDLKNIENIESFFIITNVESLRNEEICSTISSYCRQGIIDMVAIDEIHKCKNPSSQQGKGILKMQPKIRIAMTGTPLMNTPLDLFIILKWLGYEKHTFYAFKNHYCVMGGFGGYDIVGYKNLNDLQEQMNEIMLRRLKDDVLDLPEKYM